MHRKLAVVTMVAAAMLVQKPTVAPLLAQDRVATLLADVRTALGGEERLAAVKALSAEGPSRRAVGARSVDSAVALLLVRPDKMRRSEESRLLGATTERISTFDGTQVWDDTAGGLGVGGGHGGFDHGGYDHGAAAGGASGDHGGWDHGQEFGSHDHADADAAGGNLSSAQIMAARVRRMKMDLQRWTIAFFADSQPPFTTAARAESPDGPADVLESTDLAGRPVRYFIDPASHLPLMLQYQEVRAQASGAQPKTSVVAMHLSGYKKVEGVMLPHQIDISIDGHASETWTIDTFKINPKVKGNVFQKPSR